MALMTLKNDTLTVSISTLGAELQSVRDAEGTERLWQGDSKYWAGRAPILFPVAGGFRDDCYVLDGKRYPMQKHGFVRKLEWKPESVEPSGATLLMDKRDEGFPFAYELRASFALAGPSLVVRYTVANRDKRAFYFSIGSHEGYAAPGGIENYEVVFDEPETLAVNALQGNLILPEPVTIAENTRVLPLKQDYFAVDALVFRNLKSRGLTLRSRLHSRTVRVDYPEHGVIMLWTRPGAEYLCIEPWCNAPDLVDADLRIDRKPGFIRLDPGETVTRQHVITF